MGLLVVAFSQSVALSTWTAVSVHKSETARCKLSTNELWFSVCFATAMEYRQFKAYSLKEHSSIRLTIQCTRSRHVGNDVWREVSAQFAVQAEATSSFDVALPPARLVGPLPALLATAARVHHGAVGALAWSEARTAVGVARVFARQGMRHSGQHSERSSSSQPGGVAGGAVETEHCLLNRHNIELVYTG